MGIFGALNTAVAGLRAQSYSLENISGNIANSQTAGFKRMDTAFADLVVERPKTQTLSGSVSAFGRQTNALQGDIQPTGISTNMAINGSGFFAVQKLAGYQDNKPVFDELDLFTRRGDFALDKDGYLVNGSGYFLKGASMNPATGEITNISGVIKLSSDPISARATSEITYKAILPSYPSTSSANPDVPGSELIPGDAAFSPGSQDAIPYERRSLFLGSSITGGSIIIYNDVGSPIDVQMRWAKTQNPDTGSGVDATWKLFFQTDSRTQSNGDTVWMSLGEFVFDGSGRLVSPDPAEAVFPPGAAIDGALVEGIRIDMGGGSLKQFSNPSGIVQGLSVSQNGYSSGTLRGISISGDGRISGLYTNGRALPIAQVSIAQFNAPNALKRADGGAFEQTMESGVPLGSTDGARVVEGSLEQSNVDIADEFSKMIVAQQAYSACTRVITTSQQMMEATIGMIR